MAKMRAIRRQPYGTPEKEGVTIAFGLAGDEFALRPAEERGLIGHILARHVEGASHMAEGYTRAKAGNIGVCIGTSGPAGTDMITGLIRRSRIRSRSCASPGRRRARASTRKTFRPSISNPLQNP